MDHAWARDRAWALEEASTRIADLTALARELAQALDASYKHEWKAKFPARGLTKVQGTALAKARAAGLLEGE